MKLPPSGLCLPCRVVKVRDGDTVEIQLPGSEHVWAIRLLDCWAPELHKQGGPEAKEFAQNLVDDVDETHVWIPAPKQVINLLANLTFDRIPGHIFISTRETLSEVMVRCGHATKEKG